MRIYLDTSALSALVAREDPRMTASTEQLFHLVRDGLHTPYISDLVVTELERTPDARRRAHLLDLVDRYTLEILPTTLEARDLALRYTNARIIPARYLPDALHIVTATVHNVPLLASWNFAHIVKHRTRVEVNRLNQAVGYPTIDLCTPEEV